jgi:hypothetical protein
MLLLWLWLLLLRVVVTEPLPLFVEVNAEDEDENNDDDEDNDCWDLLLLLFLRRALHLGTDPAATAGMISSHGTFLEHLRHRAQRREPCAYTIFLLETPATASRPSMFWLMCAYDCCV